MVRGCNDVGLTQPLNKKLALLSRYLQELLLLLLPPGFVIDGRAVEAR